MIEIDLLIKIIQAWIIKIVLLESIIVILAYVLIKKLLNNKIKNNRIQLIERVNKKQINRELKNAIFTLLISFSFTCVLMYLNSFWYTQVYSDFSKYNIVWWIFSFLLLLIIDDTWFYWYHRFLHIPKVFKKIHFEHHKSFDVNPFSSLSFHFIEPLFLFFWMIPIIFIIPIYTPFLFFIQTISILNNVKSHLWYEFFPRWWNKSMFWFVTSSTHHNMHHSKINGNYWAYFRIWDRFIWTEFPDYETIYDSIHNRMNEKKI